jgi:hypothetical protein
VIGDQPTARPHIGAEQRDGSGSEPRPPVRGRPRTIPRWPFALIATGLVVAGPAGLLLATSVACALLVLRMRLLAPEAEPPELPALRWRRRAPVPVLPGFTRTVGSVEWGLASAYDFDTALRPRLARVAADRLAERRGIDFYDQRALAANALGAEAWDLLDPARPPAPDRSVPGPDRSTLARVLDAIEQI